MCVIVWKIWASEDMDPDSGPSIFALQISCQMGSHHSNINTSGCLVHQSFLQHIIPINWNNGLIWPNLMVKSGVFSSYWNLSLGSNQAILTTFNPRWQTPSSFWEPTWNEFSVECCPLLWSNFHDLLKTADLHWFPYCSHHWLVSDSQAPSLISWMSKKTFPSLSDWLLVRKTHNVCMYTVFYPQEWSTSEIDVDKVGWHNIHTLIPSMFRGCEHSFMFPSCQQ